MSRQSSSATLTRRSSVSTVTSASQYEITSVSPVGDSSIREICSDSAFVEPRRVLMVIGHHSFVAVAFAHSVFCYRSKDSVGWELIFSTPYLENCVEKMALNAKVSSSSLGDKMLAVSSGKSLNVVMLV
ncbi:PREDICTED: BTB/POZ domain-containing protein KCTD3-like [Acropora digitifera]|uniref:BTB/POZ domain-containing protein KCTD3-like n=1 Tax=Acropora digitifera TaxID=70779 RepID=UPI00077AD4B4|nr:PREDICTED: BTB/POZ domain-containing protein KCTD3-like [Acropora digitifera]